MFRRQSRNGSTKRMYKPLPSAEISSMYVPTLPAVRRLKPVLVLLISIPLLICSRDRSMNSDKSDTLTQRLDSLLQTIPDFSGIVYVSDHGKTKFHKAFGYRSFQMREANDTASIFELASLSKQFTAMIIMMLKEDGKLTYEDLVSEYIPELPYAAITIRHLLTHTSGLPDYQDVMDKHWDKTKVAGNPDCIEYLNKYAPPKRFEAGEKYEYSNTGYLLLASIAEKAKIGRAHV